MKKRIAKITISDAFLLDALHLPSDTQIVFSDRETFDSISLTVIQKDLKEIEIVDGQPPPIVVPKITKLPNGFFDRCEYQFDWNQK
jgi:hypothetical protein